MLSCTFHKAERLKFPLIHPQNKLNQRNVPTQMSGPEEANGDSQTNILRFAISNMVEETTSQ